MRRLLVLTLALAMGSYLMECEFVECGLPHDAGDSPLASNALNPYGLWAAVGAGESQGVPVCAGARWSVSVKVT